MNDSLVAVDYLSESGSSVLSAAVGHVSADNSEIHFAAPKVELCLYWLWKCLEIKKRELNKENNELVHDSTTGLLLSLIVALPATLSTDTAPSAV
jgi:hypothetical protein